MLLTPEVCTRFGSANTRMLMLAYRVSGGDNTSSENLSMLGEPLIIMLDTLVDLVSDIQRGVLNIPSESLEYWGISSELLNCKSWKDIAASPSVSSWYIEQANQVWKDWVEIKPEMIRMIESIPSLPLRAFMREIGKKTEKYALTCKNRFN